MDLQLGNQPSMANGLGLTNSGFRTVCGIDLALFGGITYRFGVCTTFPFKVHPVSGSEVATKLGELDTAGEGIPIILGGADEFERITETFEMNDRRSTQEAINVSLGINPGNWFEERHASDPEYYDIQQGEWPDEDPGPRQSLTSHRDLLSGAFLSQVHIAVIPAAEA